MFLLAIQFDRIEVAVFSFSLLLLTATIYFVRRTFIGLQSIKQQQERTAHCMVSSYGDTPPAPKRDTSAFAFFTKHIPSFSSRGTVESRALPVTYGNTRSDESIDSMKESILLHKRQLDALLARVDSLKQDQHARPAERNEDAELRNKIERLELLLEEREETLQAFKNKTESAEMMASRLESVQREFDRVQEKLRGVEQQARAASQLAVELEDVKAEYSRLQQEHGVKQHQLEELLNQNNHLNRQLSETEGRYTDADNQRQQYMKKARVMEDLNTDFQSVSDNNFRMRGELRRVGELESMLHIITEERDHLLHRGTR